MCGGKINPQACCDGDYQQHVDVDDNPVKPEVPHGIGASYLGLGQSGADDAAFVGVYK